ncbi:hypothetical protein [Endozoicomonas arenosclerae]|uniref:hypothetical protein n=1 Tax=Endozoicomonas arenosclerae TaxID=1633495 RepID=UPI0007826DF0|nr:hypothetical protein [Endozoicomonas arenosclerae]
MLDAEPATVRQGHYQKISDYYQDALALSRAGDRAASLEPDKQTGRLKAREVSVSSYLATQLSLAAPMAEVSKAINQMTVAAAEWEQKLQMPVSVDQFKVSNSYDPNPEALSKHLDGLLNQKSSQYLRLSERLLGRLRACGDRPEADWKNTNRQYEAIEQEFFDGYRRLVSLYDGDLEALNKKFHEFLDLSVVSVQGYLETLPVSGQVRQQLMDALYQRMQLFIDLMESYCLQTESQAGHLSITRSISGPAAMPAPGFPFLNLRTYKTPDSGPFYMEPQQAQSCSQHAANAFFGGPLVLLPVSRDPKPMDEILPEMKDIIRRLNDQDIFGQPMLIRGGQFLMSEDLAKALDNLKHDRVMLVSGINSHYVCFRRDAKGQWHKLESVAYEKGEQEVISPGRYLLERIYNQQDLKNLGDGDAQVDIIHLEGEELPGVVFQF